MFQSKFTSLPIERRRERKFAHAGLISPRATINKQATIMIFEDEYEIISSAGILSLISQLIYTNSLSQSVV